jgi:hypothetical protein
VIATALIPVKYYFGQYSFEFMPNFVFDGGPESISNHPALNTF